MHVCIFIYIYIYIYNLSQWDLNLIRIWFQSELKYSQLMYSKDGLIDYLLCGSDSMASPHGSDRIISPFSKIGDSRSAFDCFPRSFPRFCQDPSDLLPQKANSPCGIRTGDGSTLTMTNWLAQKTCADGRLVCWWIPVGMDMWWPPSFLSSLKRLFLNFPFRFLGVGAAAAAARSCWIIIMLSSLSSKSISLSASSCQPQSKPFIITNDSIKIDRSLVSLTNDSSSKHKLQVIITRIDCNAPVLAFSDAPRGSSAGVSLSAAPLRDTAIPEGTKGKRNHSTAQFKPTEF